MHSQITTFQFFTYNDKTKRCGLRDYQPGALIKAPTQRTGSKAAGIIADPNKVFVGKAIEHSNRYKCLQACSNEPRCNSVTFNGPNSANPNICVLNFAKIVRKLPLPDDSDIASSFKFYPSGMKLQNKLYFSGRKLNKFER